MNILVGTYLILLSFIKIYKQNGYETEIMKQNTWIWSSIDFLFGDGKKNNIFISGFLRVILEVNVAQGWSERLQVRRSQIWVPG